MKMPPMTYPSIRSRAFPDFPLLSFRSVSRRLFTRCESQILSRFPGTKTTVSAVKLRPSAPPSARYRRPNVRFGRPPRVCARRANNTRRRRRRRRRFGFCVHFEHGTNVRVRALHTLFDAADNVLLIFPFPPPSICTCMYVCIQSSAYVHIRTRTHTHTEGSPHVAKTKICKAVRYIAVSQTVRSHVGPNPVSIFRG